MICCHVKGCRGHLCLHSEKSLSEGGRTEHFSCGGIGPLTIDRQVGVAALPIGLVSASSQRQQGCSIAYFDEPMLSSGRSDDVSRGESLASRPLDAADRDGQRRRGRQVTSSNRSRGNNSLFTPIYVVLYSGRSDDAVDGGSLDRSEPTFHYSLTLATCSQ